MSLHHRKKRRNPIKILLHIPVPWVYVLSYLAGLVPKIFFPITIGSPTALISVKIAGALLFAVGAFGLLAQAWPLIVLPFTLAYINLIVIPVEEDLLEKEFKEEYKDYSSRVNRWF